VEPDPEKLRDLLLKGRNRTDFGREVIEELGFRYSMWNRNPAAVSLSGKAGAYPTANIPNNVVLNFPDPTGSGVELYEPSTLQQIFETVVDAWDPDWAILGTRPWRDAQDPGQNEPQIGWMDYFAESPTRHLPVNVPGAEPFHHGMRLRQGFSPADVTTEQILLTRDHLKALGALAPTRWVLPDGTVPLPPQPYECLEKIINGDNSTPGWLIPHRSGSDSLLVRCGIQGLVCG
jgi:hypothetical protein